MTGKEIGRVKTHFDSLDNKLSSGLRQSMRSETSVEPNTLRYQRCLRQGREDLQSTKLYWSRRA